MAADDPERVADDISQIVDYLNNKRSHSHERTAGLAHEIAHRRDLAGEISASVARQSTPERPHVTSQTQPQQQEPRVQTVAVDSEATNLTRNPLMAERYHTFCRDLDVLMDSFRARIESNKPVQH